VGKSNMTKLEKNVKKVLAETKKEKSVIDTIASICTTTPKTIVESTGFKNAGCEIVTYSILGFLFSENSDPQKSMKKFFKAMAELKPRNGFEGMLISQMICVYESAMACFEVANRNKQHPDIFIKRQNQGVKLMRLYSQLLETLDKHRNKGKQKMTVEHVHINKGGQAIIGDIHHKRRKGGAKIEK